MIKNLKIKGHIIDSLILSKLLDKISEMGLECYATDVKVGRKREDVSEATFIMESSSQELMEKALEYAKKQGATEL